VIIKSIAAKSSPIALLVLLSLKTLPSHSESDKQRIVSLSPHLTEIVFALGREKQLVGVSDYSDYPYSQGCIDKRCSVKIPSMANYQGADISAIIRSEPTLILAWDGGNKAQDIARLEQLGYPVFRSSPANIETLLQEILNLGKTLHAVSKSKKLHERMTAQAQQIRAQYANKNAGALYYMSQQPLSGMGSDIWLNSLLSLCNIDNIYANLPASYAQFSVADIIRKQPEIVIAATHQDALAVTQFWAPHSHVFNPKVVVVNPDALHRFTPRVLPELAMLCKKVYF
jgi:vitamin B12 transport system substrate-binding protein